MPINPCVDDFELVDLLVSLGMRAANSTWYCNNVECLGDGAQEMYVYDDGHLPISGSELIKIASRIYQTIDGYFKAYENGETQPWLIIRAVDGAGFDVESSDASALETLRQHFPNITEMHSGKQGYTGIYITYHPI